SYQPIVYPFPVPLPILTLPPIVSPRFNFGTLSAVPMSTPAQAAAAPASTTIDDWVQVARDDLANRLHVSGSSALLVSIESPSTNSPTPIGTQFVLRLGNQNSLYQVTDDHAVQLLDGNYHFGPPSKPAGGEPSFDVTRDGHVSPVDLFSV